MEGLDVVKGIPNDDNAPMNSNGNSIHHSGNSDNSDNSDSSDSSKAKNNALQQERLPSLFQNNAGEDIAALSPVPSNISSMASGEEESQLKRFILIC